MNTRVGRLVIAWSLVLVTVWLGDRLYRSYVDVADELKPVVPEGKLKQITATNAYEVNIFDTRPDPRYGTGAIVNVAKVDPMPKAGGKWNTFEITAKGPQLTVVLNGTQTVDIQDSKFASGPFALQYGSGVVKFRKVEIRPL
jgi:hypothetical protein